MMPAWSLALLLATAPQLTADEAVARAAARNPAIRAADRAYDAAQARLTQAEAWPNPNLTLSVDQVPVANPIAGNYMAGIGQPLLPGALRSARAELAQVEVGLAAIAAEHARRSLATDVRLAYVRHQFDHEETRAARLGLEAAQAALGAANARYKAGELARIDVLRAEVEAGRARRELAGAESREAQSLGELNVLLDQPMGTEIEVQPFFTGAAGAAGAAPPLPPLPALVALATARRPELREAELSIRREAAQREVARAGLWTGTEATAAAGLIGGNPGFTTTLTVPVPLYRQQGEIAEAEANQGRAEAERDALRHRVVLEVQRAYHEAAIAARQVQLHRAELLPQAARLAENAQRRYAVGEGSGLEVWEARRGARQAASDLARAQLDHRQAIVRLEAAVAGPLP